MNNIKKVLLIISGGIAAYKSLEIIRIFIKNNIKVTSILTKGGSKFITPLSVASLSSSKVYSELFDLKDESEMGHIQLSREADIILVAPASANIIARTSNGFADDLASAVLLASNKPIFFAPSMNVEMWKNPITQKNIHKLKSHNIKIIGPETGDLACREEGYGRMSEPEEIFQFLLSAYKKKTLKINVLITAGPTYEAIDPVRFLGNRSSGKQGIEIAKSLASHGAKVSLILGPTQEKIPENIRVTNITSAKEMLIETKKFKNIDVAICAAAVSDWSIKKPSSIKIKKNNNKPSLNLVNNPDILQNISNRKSNRPKLVIGFAAETNDLEKNAKKKLLNKKCDWILANDVLKNKNIFGGDKNKITFISTSKIEKWQKTSKKNIANKLSLKIINFMQNEKN